MKIYTKQGDDGTTFIPNKGRVKKYDCSVDAQGEIDELNCWIGMIFSQIRFQDVFISNLSQVQVELMEMGAQLATGKIVITKEKIEKLEDGIDKMTKNLPSLTNFILPRWPEHVHVARAVCRRTERVIASWKNKALNEGEDCNQFHLVIPYLNRLSDYLFTLARHVSQKDIIWKSVSF